MRARERRRLSHSLLPAQRREAGWDKRCEDRARPSEGRAVSIAGTAMPLRTPAE
jgi:hypothetical protein